MTSSYSSYINPPMLFDDRGDPLRPSQRFARPGTHGPAFLDEAFSQHQSSSSSQTYSFSFKQPSSTSATTSTDVNDSNINGSPLSTASSSSHAFSATDSNNESPPTSVENDPSLSSPFRGGANRITTSYNKPLPSISGSATNITPSINQSHLNHPSSYSSAPPPLSLPNIPKSPNGGRKSFFKFGKGTTSSSPTSGDKANVQATATSPARKEETSKFKHVRRGSARNSADHRGLKTSSAAALWNTSSPSNEEDSRAGRSVARSFISNMGRRGRSKSAAGKSTTAASSPPPVLPHNSMRGFETPSSRAPIRHEDSASSTMNANWVIYPTSSAKSTYEPSIRPASIRKEQGVAPTLRPSLPIGPSSSSSLPQISAQHIKQQGKLHQPGTTGSDATTPTPRPASGGNVAELPKTPSPIKTARQRALPRWSRSTQQRPPPMSSPTGAHKVVPPAGSGPPPTPFKSPPFFMRKKANNATTVSSSASPASSPAKGNDQSNTKHKASASSIYAGTSAHVSASSSPSASYSPPAPGQNMQMAWPAASHVFGAAQQVIGNAFIGPQTTNFDYRAAATQASSSSAVPSTTTVEPISKNFSRTQEQVNGRLSPIKDESPMITPTDSSVSLSEDVFSSTRGPSKDPRIRVQELLAAHQSRKSSLFSSSGRSSFNQSSASSIYASGMTTPQPPPRQCKGHPRIEEALIKHSGTILATLLDYLSYRSFKHLTQVSSAMRKAARNDNGEFAEIARQRFLASYGYRSLPPSTIETISPLINFTLRDLDAFHEGIFITVADYAMFAREHQRSPLDSKTVKMLKESTRAFNKLVIRLRMQSPGGEDEAVLLPLVRSHWAAYGGGRRGEHFQKVHKSGRCASLRVWVPCGTQWMSDEEILEVEKEVNRSGVWAGLRKGDLVRNIALGDIANEGLLIFDGRYLRDLAYTYDTIGHLPSWINVFLFTPSYFHNQIACSTPSPIVYFDLSPFSTQVQQNLLLCKEKVDVASPTGDTYMITRYVYRTVVDLSRGMVLQQKKGERAEEGANAVLKGDSNDTEMILHPGWAGQIVIETDGTTEAAKSLLQRATPSSREIEPNQPRPPLHPNNRPYRILRNMSRPGLIFCRVVQDAPLPPF